ncbi:unnamed protein product [Caenorhabditis brenneri]
MPNKTECMARPVALFELLAENQRDFIRQQRPRIILNISREKYQEAERIFRDQKNRGQKRAREGDSRETSRNWNGTMNDEGLWNIKSTPGTAEEPEATIDHPVCCLPATSNVSLSPRTTQKLETDSLPACQLTSTSKIYNVPIDLAMDPSQLEIVFALLKELAENTKLKESKVINLQNEESKLKTILEGLKGKSDKLRLLQIQKSEVAAKKLVQEENQ